MPRGYIGHSHNKFISNIILLNQSLFYLSLIDCLINEKGVLSLFGVEGIRCGVLEEQTSDLFTGVKQSCGSETYDPNDIHIMKYFL